MDVDKEDDSRSFVFRDDQSSQIEIAIGSEQEALFPAVLILGSEGSGRLHTTLSILRRCSKRFIVLNSDLIYSDRHLFEQILFRAENLLGRITDDSENDEANDDQHSSAKLNCARAFDFVRRLGTLFAESQFEETLFLVLRNADHLAARLPTSTFRSLLRINESFVLSDVMKQSSVADSNRNSQRNDAAAANFNPARVRLCTIMIMSQTSLAALSESKCALLDDAFVVRFGAYSKEELTKIVTRRTGNAEQLLQECYQMGLLQGTNCPSEKRKSTAAATTTGPDVIGICRALAQKVKCVPIETYVDLIVQTFFAVCRSIEVLHRLVVTHFPRFVEPLLNASGTNSAFDFLANWKRFEAIVKRSLRCGALHALSYDVRTFESLKVNIQATSTGQQQLASIDSTAALHTELSLPLVDTFLLISAYIAARNPAHTDAIYFAKRRARGSSKSAKPNKNDDHDGLPQSRAFTLHRLSGIFEFIFDPHCVILPKISKLAQKEPAEDSETAESEQEQHNKGRYVDSVASHVQTLVQHGLLTPLSHEQTDLTAPRFRLMLDIDVIRSLSRSVHFDLAKYLCDST